MQVFKPTGRLYQDDFQIRCPSLKKGFTFKLYDEKLVDVFVGGCFTVKIPLGCC